MPSNARKTLDANRDDLERIWELHEQEAGNKRGRKFNVDVLNRAAVLMVCAAWEAYCEDIVAEAVEVLTKDCQDPSKLPQYLRTFVSKKIKSAAHEQAAWEMAGDGWRKVIAANAADAVKRLTGSWNTPKSTNVIELFSTSLGINDISGAWHWAKNPVQQVREKLDAFVSLRGEIAHRLKAENSVHKRDGTEFFDLVRRLADSIDGQVHATLKAATNKDYW